MTMRILRLCALAFSALVSLYMFASLDRILVRPSMQTSVLSVRAKCFYVFVGYKARRLYSSVSYHLPLLQAVDVTVPYGTGAGCAAAFTVIAQ